MVIRDPLLGQLLNGRYRVDTVVARGGMAMVYRGTDMLLESTVGIKVMHGHLSADETFVERFEREAENAARLVHPNLVAVHDQQRDGDVVYLVMEYLESVTLRKELKHRGRLTPRQAIVVTDAILAALEVVHGADMIHRDLKPDNILLGADGQIKLADFGLARAVTSATTTKTLIGTVGYVAPELVTRTGADHRTDLYTLGIMLYEMLTGQLPYTDEVPIQVAYRHVHDRVPPPSAVVPGLDPELDAIVLWATARDPEERPSDAAAFRAELGRLRAELSTAALDFGAAAAELPAADGAPVLTPTAGLERPTAQPVAKERKARTDEIPFVGDAEGAQPAAEPGTAGAPEDAAAGTEDAAGGLPAAAFAAETAARTRATEAGAVTGEPARATAPAGAAEGHDGARAGALAASAPAAQGATRAPALGAGGGRRRRTARRALGITAATAVVMLGGWSAIALTNPADGESTEAQTSTPPAKPLVPAVQAGTEAKAAEQALRSAGFEPALAQEYSESAKAGTVIGTDPKAGTALPEHSTVHVRVSKGAQRFAVPDVTGSSLADAKAALAKAGLKAGDVKSKHSASVAKGTVIAQADDAGAKLRKGAAVDLTVSKGEAPVEIPNVKGYGYKTAFGKLIGAGFRVARQDVYSDSVAKGSVVSQYPGAGAERKKDALVFLKVSKGKKPEKSDEKKAEKSAAAKSDAAKKKAADKQAADKKKAAKK